MPEDDTRSDPWLAIGLELMLVPTAQGGRTTSIRFDAPPSYRPNWGLPGSVGTEQTGAPVLCCSVRMLAPGESARAVIIPLTDAHLTEWRLLVVGDRLRMFEGPRVCGHAIVLWAQGTHRPVPSTDEAWFRAWTRSSDDQP